MCQSKLFCILACAEYAKNEWDNEIVPGHFFGTRTH